MPAFDIEPKLLMFPNNNASVRCFKKKGFGDDDYFLVQLNSCNCTWERLLNNRLTEETQAHVILQVINKSIEKMSRVILFLI